MGFRIDKSWVNRIPQVGIKRKDDAAATDDVASVGDQPQKGGQNPYQQRQSQQQNQQSPRQYNRDELEKAVADMRAEDAFTDSGMQAEIVDTSTGAAIRLSQSNGTTIKSMSAEEFMRLRENSIQEVGIRGKIIDQKF